LERIEMVLTTQISTPSDHEIIMTREFDAPRELVFNAYTDPEFIPNWWGPRTHTTTVDVMDVRAGGRWRYVLRDGEGNEFACRGEYLEIDPPHRLVSTFESEGMPGHIVTETMTLEERDGKTLLTTIRVFTSVEDRDWMMTGVEADAPGMMDRLANVLAELQKG
jgi:uncharacterized protein YndB with AHSA1/START domain